MKTIVQITFLLVLVGILSSVGFDAFRALTPPIKELFDLELVSESKASITYVLDASRWTTFGLTSAKSTVRLITNASVSPNAANTVKEKWPYAIEIQLKDKVGNVLFEQTYNNLAQITEYADDNGGTFFSNFFVDNRAVPADHRVIRIPLAGLDDSARLQCRLTSKHPDIRDITLRAYVYNSATESNPERRWQRLSPDRQVELARGNVYPPHLLLAQEKINLLQTTWKPLGPLGIPGEDYNSRTLYQRTDLGVARAEREIIMPTGLAIGNGYRGVIPIPPLGGVLRLSFDTIAGALLPIEGSLDIRWFGQGYLDREKHTMDWNMLSKGYRTDVQGGLLEIESSFPLIVRAYIESEKESNEITPTPFSVRGFVALGENTVEYNVNHIRGRKVSFRLDIRREVDPELVENHKNHWNAKYTLLDNQGKSLFSGDLAGGSIISNYDYPNSHDSNLRITEPASHFWILPENVSRVRISSDVPTIVVAYNRPADLIRAVQVPKVYSAYDPEEMRDPVWFMLKPRNYQDHIREGRNVLLGVQFRPPADDPELIAGRYSWESYAPEGAWVGKYLLIPRDAGSPFRANALTSTFVALDSNTEIALRFQPKLPVPTLLPKVMFMGSSGKSLEVSTYLDGKLHDRRRLFGAQGEFELPKVGEGVHRLKFVCESNIRFFVNQVNLSEMNPGIVSYSKMLAATLKNREVEFLYEKTSQDEEVLSMRLFSPNLDRGTDSTVLRLRADRPVEQELGPNRATSFLDRRYIVAPEEEKETYVLHSKDETVDGGQRLFLTLGEDCPPGNYRIQISVEEGTGKYIVLYRANPGEFQERTFYRGEPVDAI